MPCRAQLADKESNLPSRADAEGAQRVECPQMASRPVGGWRLASLLDLACADCLADAVIQTNLRIAKRSALGLAPVYWTIPLPGALTLSANRLALTPELLITRVHCHKHWNRDNQRDEDRGKYLKRSRIVHDAKEYYQPNKHCRYNHPNRHVHLQNSVASLQYSADTLFHPSSYEHYTKSEANAPRGCQSKPSPNGSIVTRS